MGGAVQGVAVGVVTVASDAVVGGPVAVSVRRGGVHAFHREIAGRAGTGRPGAAIAVGRVNQAAAVVAQEERSAAVEQIAGVDLVSGDVADRGVVGAFQQIKAMRRQDAGEGNGDATIAGGEGPAVEALRRIAGVEKLHPLIGAAGGRAAPGHFVDDDGLLTGRGC